MKGRISEKRILEKGGMLTLLVCFLMIIILVIKSKDDMIITILLIAGSTLGMIMYLGSDIISKEK